MFKFEFQAPLEKLEYYFGEYHVVYIPSEIIEQLDNNKNIRVKIIFNKLKTAHLSIKSINNSVFFVVNNRLRKQLKIYAGDKVHVYFEKDKSKYGMPMPEELLEMLNQEETANAHFHKLSPGKQRSLIHLVSQLKNTEPRIKKALGVVEHLTENNGELDFKALNEKFKEINQRYR